MLHGLYQALKLHNFFAFSYLVSYHHGFLFLFLFVGISHGKIRQASTALFNLNEEGRRRGEKARENAATDTTFFFFVQRKNRSLYRFQARDCWMGWFIVTRESCNMHSLTANNSWVGGPFLSPFNTSWTCTRLHC